MKRMDAPTMFGRRSFLSLCGGSLALSFWLRSAVARAQGAPGPKRFMILHRPNGTISENWLPQNKPGSILQPFSAVWPWAVALKGVNVRPSNGSTGGSHEAGLVTLMTGAPLGPTYKTNDDFSSTAQSLDQKLLKASPLLGGTPVPSLQVAAHGDQDGSNEIPNTTLSYAGKALPLYPTLNPSQVYQRVFGSLMPGGNTDPNAEALAKARARRRSVLDFVSADLTRARAQFPSSFRSELDIHEATVRELEKTLEEPTTEEPTCVPPTDVQLTAGGDYNNVAKVGAQHLKIIAAAFKCDLTRVVTFMWGTGASSTAFSGLGTNNHHSTSHANSRSTLSAVDRWYSEKTAPFLSELAATPDPTGGMILDNTLVWYINEVSEGWNHSFNDYPFVLFGGAGVGLQQRGRVHDVSGQGKTSNDVWRSLAPVFGTELSSFGTQATGPISGLFTV